MIAIVDYGSGNIQAIKNIYKRLNIPCEVSASPDVLSNADKLILPGVGAFDDSMNKLNTSGLKIILDKQVLEEKIPILGVCVGMQIMANSSEEGNSPGLGWIDAKVRRFDEESLLIKPKLPHMGWNSIASKKESSILNGIDKNKGFYFLHSYFIECNDKENILTTTDYCSNFASSFSKSNIYGFQFHPEKSHANGIQLFKNFAAI